MKSFLKKIKSFLLVCAMLVATLVLLCGCGSSVTTETNGMGVKLQSGGSARVSVCISKDKLAEDSQTAEGFETFFAAYVNAIQTADGSDDSDVIELESVTETEDTFVATLTTRRIDKIGGLGEIVYQAGNAYASSDGMDDVEWSMTGLDVGFTTSFKPDGKKTDYVFDGIYSGVAIGVDKYANGRRTETEFEDFKNYLSSTKDKIVVWQSAGFEYIESIRLEVNGKLRYVSTECVEVIDESTVLITPVTAYIGREDTNGDGEYDVFEEVNVIFAYLTYTPDLAPIAIAGIVAGGIILAALIFCCIRFKWIPRFFKSKVWQKMKKYWLLYVMLVPGLALLILFHYLPLGGLVTAFQDYSLFDGYASEFIGLKNFEKIFFARYDQMYRVFRNTIFISLLRIGTNFPVILLLALFVHSIRSKHGKALFQGISFIPYFISWTAVSGMANALLSTDSGIINHVLVTMGFERIHWFSTPDVWWGILSVSSLWKGAGWGTLIYIAAMCNIDNELYEACALDGGGALRQAFSVTLPSIMSVVCLQLILDAGSVMKDNYEQILALIQKDTSALNSTVEVIGKYTYNQLGTDGMGTATAMGLIQSVIGLILVLFANGIVKKTDNEGIL